MVNYTELGKRIRYRRQLLGKTQKEVAAQINIAASYYSNIERGIRIPSIDTLVDIANVLETGVDMLLIDSLANALPRRSDDEIKVISRFLREEIDKMDYSIFDQLQEEGLIDGPLHDHPLVDLKDPDEEE